MKGMLYTTSMTHFGSVIELQYVCYVRCRILNGKPGFTAHGSAMPSLKLVSIGSSYDKHKYDLVSVVCIFIFI